MLDSYAHNVIEQNPNMMIPWYLMAAYAYYIEDDPLVSDQFYDQLVLDLQMNYRFIDHYHKHLIDEDALKAGTFLGEYPSIVAGAVKDLRNNAPVAQR